MLNSKEFVRELQLRHESAWMNPNLESADAALAALPLTRTDVDDAEARLERFAPFIKKVFPETAADRGLIESPLTEIENMRAWLNENEGAQLAGKLFLKRDSDLPVAGSVKARGGCYAVLKHTEDLALATGWSRCAMITACLPRARSATFSRSMSCTSARRVIWG